MNTKTFGLAKWFAFVLLLSLGSAALAADTTSAMGSLGLALDQLQKNFDNGQTKILHFAQGVFYILAALSFTWNAIQWMFAETGADQIIAELTKKFLYLGIFAALLGVPGFGESLAVSALNKVRDSAIQVAGSYDGGINKDSMNPQKIISTGFAVSYDIGMSSLKALKTPEGGGAGAPAPSTLDYLKAPVETMSGNFFAAIIKALLAFACIVIAWMVAAYVLFAFLGGGVQMAVLNIEFAIVSSLGLFYLAGSGSEWTSDYRNKWLGFVINYMLKFALLTALLTLGAKLLVNQVNILLDANATQNINTPEEWAQLLMSYVALAAVAYIFKALIDKVPESVSALFSASPSGQSAAIANSAQHGTIGMAAGGAKAAGSAASYANTLRGGGAAATGGGASTPVASVAKTAAAPAAAVTAAAPKFGKS